MFEKGVEGTTSCVQLPRRCGAVGNQALSKRQLSLPLAEQVCGCARCGCLRLVNKAKDMNNTELLLHGASATAVQW